MSTLLERDLAKLRELQAEEQATDQTIGDMKSQLDQLPIAEMNLGNLERDIDTKQAILSVLLKKYQDSLLAQSTDQRLENAKILSLAAVPLKPVFPRLWLNLILGLVFSVVVSFSRRLLPGILGRFPQDPGRRGALSGPLRLRLYTGTLK